MKLNNIVEENKNNIDSLEVSDIYKLLKIKYSFEFEDKKVYSLAKVLYKNGIRSYMFFDKKLDVDEIVYYLLHRNKIKKFPVKAVYSFDCREDALKCSGDKIVKFSSFVKRKVRK